MTMGVAMQMQWQLRQLMQKHGIAPERQPAPSAGRCRVPAGLSGSAAIAPGLSRIIDLGTLGP